MTDVKSAQLESFLIDEATAYNTILPESYKNRKKWKPTDNKKVIAFLPGTVTHLLVEKDELVKEGQTVMKFDAMKMINNVQALTSGKVKEIFVKIGDKFPKGFVLMEFE